MTDTEAITTKLNRMAAKYGAELEIEKDSLGLYLPAGKRFGGLADGHTFCMGYRGPFEFMDTMMHALEELSTITDCGEFNCDYCTQ